jgi:hypothetical protein
MIGRILGALAGAFIAFCGAVILRPAAVSRIFHLGDRVRHLKIGPFELYRDLTGELIVAVGAAVILAALQRKIEKKSARPATHLFAETEAVAPAQEA